VTPGQLTLILALFQLPNPPSGAPSWVAHIWWVVLLLFLAVAGIITLLVTRQGKVEATQEKRAIAAEGLVKTRDAEKAQLEKELAKAQENCNEVEAEWKTLVGVDIDKLMKFWAEKERIEGEIEFLKSQLRAKEAALAKYEKGA